jgi:hypothetical protein
LLYALEQGPVEKTIIEQSRRQNLPLPDKIANAPVLEIGLDLYYTAFLELMTCRSVGFSAGPIPWLAINEYCNAHEIYGEQKDDVIFHVHALDSVYLDWSSKQLEKKDS